MTDAPSQTAAPNHTRAAGLLLVGVLILSLQDSTVKLVAEQTSFWQFQTLRSALNIALLAGLAAFGVGFSALRVRRWGPVTVRSLFLTACMFCFFAGAPKLSFAQMGAGLYTYPMFVTLLSGLVLREPVGIWRFSAMAASACGAALILKPFSAEFSAWQILPVLAGFFYACNVLTLRRWCVEEHPMALALAVGGAFLISGAIGVVVLTLWPPAPQIIAATPYVAIGWPEVTLMLIGVVIFASVCNLSGNLCLSRAYQTAPPAWLAPFDYTYLGFVVIWSVLLFGDRPDATALAGIALIALSGVVTALREVRRAPSRRRRGPIR